MSRVNPDNEDQVSVPGGSWAARCKAKANSTQRRCTHAARSGFSVCYLHGAGRHGTDPRKGRIRSGKTATEPAWAALRATDPKFAERLAHYENRPAELKAMDKLLARMWALSDCLAERVQAFATESGGEVPPPLLAALNGLSAAIERAEKVEALHREAGVITVAVFREYMRAVLAVVTAYVPPEALDEAMAQLGAIELTGRTRAEIADVVDPEP